MEIKSYFVYVKTPLSPHFVHKSWAESINSENIKLSMNPATQYEVAKKFIKNFIKLKNEKILLIIESLYALPFVYFVKKKLRDKLITVSIIADTTFYPPKFNIIRKTYFEMFKLKYMIDYFIAVSKTIKSWIIRFGFREDQVFVNHPFSILETNEEEIKNKEIKKSVSFIGNFTKLKAAKRILKISKNMKDTNFYIIGSVCKKIVIKEENVKCYYNLSWEDLKKILLSSSIYLHPFEFDPFPVCVIDSMRCGNYPLVYKFVGVSEVLRKDNILLSLDESYITKKLEETFDSISKRDFYYHYKISKRFTKEKSTQNFKKIIQKLLI